MEFLKRIGIRRASTYVLTPSLAFLAVFFYTPFIIVLLYSIGVVGIDGVVSLTPTFKYFIEALNPLYLRVILNSLYLAALTTISCLAIAYPAAYYIALKASYRLRSLLIVAVILPYWISFLLRTYALMTILSSLNMLFTYQAVIIGMIYDYLPFMILPLYVNLEKLDKSLLEASYTLGANPIKTFFKVTLPLSMQGIVAGCILVFVPATGEFIVPYMLGGVSVTTIGTLTWDLFLKFHNWWRGAALSIIYIFIVFTILVIYVRKIGGVEL
jgi:spermidine/putrescine transport system permease protein